jgi:arylsulfatase A-like enzyme
MWKYRPPARDFRIVVPQLCVSYLPTVHLPSKILLLATAAFLLGCPQNSDSDRSRRISMRLWENMEVGSGKSPRCAVGDVLRPSLGCSHGKQIFAGPLTTDNEGTAFLDLKRPESLRGQAALIKSVRNPRNLLDDGALPPLLLSAGTDRLQGELSGAGDPHETIKVTVHTQELSSSRRVWRSMPQEIAQEQSLVVHLGQNPRAVAVGTGPTRFRIAVESEGERHDLLDEVLRPNQPAVWQKHSIALGQFSGQEVIFRFEAEPEAGPGANLIAPLFGSPLLTRPVDGAKPPSVILISLDTLRGDFVGQVRNGSSLTRNIDAFGRQGVTFAKAMTTYPSTTASHMSIFTGLHPANHNVTNPARRLAVQTPMAAQLFAEAGYFTGAVTENAMISASSGFERGFDYYREEHGTSYKHILGFIEDTLGTAAQWIREHGKDPFFLFVHSYQVHRPYLPPKEHDRFIGAPEWLSVEIQEQHLKQLNAYTGEVLYTDAVVGEFLAELEKIGIGDDTIVIITSDHGEAFGVGGHLEHSLFLPESVMHVPLMIRAPEQLPADLRVDSVVSVVDILPTLLELTGQPPLPKTNGISLLRYTQDSTNPPKRAVYGENRRQIANHVTARTDTHRFVHHRNTRTLKIYTVDEDSRTETIVDSPALRNEGRALIMQYQAERRNRKNSPPNTTTVPEDTAAKLRALGYTD